MSNKNNNLDTVTQQVEEVKLLMADNINKTLERSENVQVVSDKSEALRKYSQSFSIQAKTIRQKANKKLWMIVGCGIAFLFFMIIILLIIT